MVAKLTMRKLSFFTILFGVFYLFIFCPSVVAQTQKSTTVTTRVGNPSQTIIPNGVLSTILDWDTKIVDVLKPDSGGYLSILPVNITDGTYSTGTYPGGIYWCTYSIVDSYTFAGIPGLSKGALGAVVNMRNFWKTNPKLKYVDYETTRENIKNVQPGYAMFMEKVPGVITSYEHVSMVKSITVDARGNGSLVSQDSNSTAKSHTFPIVNYVVNGTPYPVRGFGGV